MRATLFADFSANQMLPSGPVTMPTGNAAALVSGNSVITPLGVTRPTFPMSSVNHTFPSCPAVTTSGLDAGVEVVNSDALLGCGTGVRFHRLISLAWVPCQLVLVSSPRVPVRRRRVAAQPERVSETARGTLVRGSLVTGRCGGGGEEPGDFRLERVNPLLLVAGVAPSCCQVDGQLANGPRQPLLVDRERCFLVGADGAPLLRPLLGSR
jgi:hypothetical protein